MIDSGEHLEANPDSSPVLVPGHVNRQIIAHNVSGFESMKLDLVYSSFTSSFYTSSHKAK